MPIPLYGFVTGDTLGLLIFAEEQESLRSLASRLLQSASLRCKPVSSDRLRVVFGDKVHPPDSTVGHSGLGPRDVFVVIVVEADGVP